MKRLVSILLLFAIITLCVSSKLYCNKLLQEQDGRNITISFHTAHQQLSPTVLSEVHGSGYMTIRRG